MNINKAIKKQKKSFIRFMFLIGFIFIFLPILLVVYNKFNYLYIIYLCVIEILILVQIFLKIDENYLNFRFNQYKLIIKEGILKSKINIVCDKVDFVDIEGEGKDMRIILITSSRFRNKNINKVNQDFLNKHSGFQEYYCILKNNNSQSKYYYSIINKGGYKKYKLLNMIYSNCYEAIFTDKAIEFIKEYRN